MGKRKKAFITLRPVAWDGKTGNVLKYQAVAELNNYRVFSDPKPDKEKALASLMKVCSCYSNLAASVAEYAATHDGFASIIKR